MTSTLSLVLGIALIGLGAYLIYVGYTDLQSAPTERRERVTGETNREALLELIGGIVSLVIGIVLVVRGVGPRGRIPTRVP